jgi:hypothetical protein
VPKRVDRKWMSKLCGVASTAKPFTLVHRGVSYDCATDGHAALLMRGRSFKLTEDSVIKNAVRGFLYQRPWRQGVMEIERLRAWAGCHAMREKSVAQQVRVLGVTLDGSLLARYLPPDISGDAPVRVSAAGALDVVRFEHADWKVIVMPMYVTELPVNEDPNAKGARRG